jgi:phosphosulfolactate synthase (CoM biosynthesis protein A)
MSTETSTERAFAFLELNARPAKPRSRGVTEIRGPYYTPVGRPCLADLLETMGACVDTLKYAGGSFALMTRDALRALNELCHEHDVDVSTGGFLEHVLTRAEGTRDVGQAIELAKQHLDAGAQMIMIESEGITEQVREWRTDAVGRIVSKLGLEQVMFEAADPAVFRWYMRTHGVDVNLFVDHSQIVQLECLRAGIWGTDDTWGRMLTYRGWSEDEGSRP